MTRLEIAYEMYDDIIAMVAKVVAAAPSLVIVS